MKFHKAILIGQTQTSESLQSPGVITASGVLVGDVKLTTSSIDYYDSASGDYVNLIADRGDGSYLLSSSIQNFPTEVSRSAAGFGFGSGGGGSTNNAVITASANQNIITFVKGNLSTFSVEVFPSGSIQSASRAQTASVAESLFHSISSGDGIVSFDFNATSNQIVTLDTSSTHFLTPINQATGSSVVTASILDNVITFEKGNGSTFNIIVSASGGGTGSGFPFTGEADIFGTLAVEKTIGFTNDLLLIKGDSNEGEVKVNQQGVLQLDWNGVTPPNAIEGGLYYTQSALYVGI